MAVAPGKGRKPEREPEPPVVLVIPPPRRWPDDLADAARADLNEVLGEEQLRPEYTDGDAATALLEAALRAGNGVLLIAADFLNPGPGILDAMLEPLDEFGAVVMPGFDGSCLAASLGPGTQLTPATASALRLGMESGRPDVGSVIELLVREGTEVFCQPPWYRGCDESGRHCALAHMHALEVSGDPDFLAHRTQVVLRNHVR